MNNKIKFIIGFVLVAVLAVVIILSINKREKPVIVESNYGSGNEDLTNKSPTYEPPVEISFTDPTTKEVKKFGYDNYTVIKQKDGDISYVDFFVEDKWLKQNTIDSSQSADRATYKSVLEDITTAKGIKGQKYTQKNNNVLVTQYYFFDLSPDKILFVQTNTEPEDQKTIQEIINSITF
jgi:hypothetical protein